MNIYREAFLHIKELSNTFWIVVAATFINQLGNMAVVFLVVYANQQLHLTLTKSTNAFVILSISLLLSGLVAGHLIDRIGAARLMIISLILNGIILIILSTIKNYYGLLFFCILWGLVLGVYRPAAQTIISYLSKKGLHKVTFSIYRLALNLGMSIGPAIGGYLAGHSFPLIFVLNGIANILAFIILSAGFYQTKWLSKRYHAQEKTFTLKILKQNKMFSLFLLGTIPIGMVFFQHESTLPVYIKNYLNLPLSFYGWLFTINTLMIVFLELALNIATINWSYRINFIIGNAFITMGFAGIYFAKTSFDIILLTVLWTIGEMIYYPATTSYISDTVAEEQRGKYMALYNTASNLGMLLGPWMGGIIMEQFGPFNLWITCGILGLVSIAIFSTLRNQPSVNIKQ